jgi:hypothetical protein
MITVIIRHLMLVVTAAVKLPAIVSIVQPATA